MPALMRNHYERYHKQEKSFRAICHVQGCFRRRKHQDVMNTVFDQETDDLGQNDARLPTNEFNDETAFDVNDMTMDPCGEHSDSYEHHALNDENVRRLNAALLLGSKEIHKLTQKTVDTFVKNTITIAQNTVELLRGCISSHLRDAGIEDPGLQGFFNQLMMEENLAPNPFTGMETK